jgi:uncharacterized damage-inducible protein DinB
VTFAQRHFLIERLKNARQPLEDLLHQAPPDKEIYAGWTLKDLLAHISGWDHVTIEALQALEDLPDEKFNQALTFPWGETGTVAYLIEIFVEHEEHHGGHLAQWVRNPDRIIDEH